MESTQQAVATNSLAVSIVEAKTKSWRDVLNELKIGTLKVKNPPVVNNTDVNTLLIAMLENMDWHRTTTTDPILSAPLNFKYIEIFLEELEKLDWKNVITKHRFAVSLIQSRFGQANFISWIFSSRDFAFLKKMSDVTTKSVKICNILNSNKVQTAIKTVATTGFTVTEQHIVVMSGLTEARGFVSFNEVVVAEKVATSNTTIELLDITILLIHEITHLALRINKSNFNYHSPLSLKQEFKWESVYPKANEPAVLEAGCVVERLLFGFRPNWSLLREYERKKCVIPECEQYANDTWDALINNTTIPSPPSGFPARQDHVTGLDSLDLQYE